MIAAISALVLAVMLAVAPHAEAECAWVLWSQQGHQWPWLIHEAFESREKCRAALSKSFATTEGTAVYQTGDAIWICLPDTIDPRAPKGGGR